MKGLVWCLLLLMHAASAWAGGCPHDSSWQQVAPDVWVWPPSKQADVSPGNHGHVLTTSVIVHQGEAMVIDPGPSHTHGTQVREWVRCRWKAPIKWVINTHAHAENVLGNSAFEDLQKRGRLHIGASLATYAAMQGRCRQCLSHLQKTLGPSLMRGTRIVMPDRVLTNGSHLSIGGRQLQVYLLENAHTESDTVLWAPDWRVAWVGGLVYEGRVPELAQGGIDGWLKALKTLEELKPLIVLGTGVSTGQHDQAPAALAYTRQYLTQLRASLFGALDAGRHASEGVTLELGDYSGSAGYASRHGLNVQRAWREMETVWMNQEPPQTLAPDVGR